jgi:uncharacterized protein (TIGR02117 family)
VPQNLGYRQPPARDSVRIFVRSNEIHTDLVLPISEESEEVAWHVLFPPEHFARDVRKAKYVAVGWGNRAFYVATPTWAEFRLSNAAGALFFPSETVLHVEYLHDAAAGWQSREVLLSRAQYGELLKFVRATVGATDERGAAVTATTVTYGSADRFYVASGRYHLFNTCNQWTGRGLARAGVPVGIWTPLKWHVLCWLPVAEGN